MFILREKKFSNIGEAKRIIQKTIRFVNSFGYRYDEFFINEVTNMLNNAYYYL